MHGAELMTGGNLSDAMRLTRKFTLRRAMEMAVDCARGLAYLHAKKNGAIIHRSDYLVLWHSELLHVLRCLALCGMVQIGNDGFRDCCAGI